jgi:hypothetical protein
MTTVSDTRIAPVPMAEIQRIKDQLMRLRDYHPHVRELFKQVASLYQRLDRELTEQEAQQHDS